MSPLLTISKALGVCRMGEVAFDESATVLVINGVAVPSALALTTSDSGAVDVLKSALEQLGVQPAEHAAVVWKLLHSYSPAAFLLELPQGAYTAARTVNGGRSIVCYAFHVQRLQRTLAALVQDAGRAPLQPFLEDTEAASCWFSIFSTKKLRDSIRTALHQWALVYQRKQGGNGEPAEALIIIYIPCVDGNKVFSAGTSDSKACCNLHETVPVFVRCSELAPPTVEHEVVSKHAEVEFHLGIERSNPSIKYSGWVRDRKRCEELREHADSIELVIVRRASTSVIILEGLVSNIFFIYKEGYVATAVNDVLHGHMRELVLRVCEAHNVPLRLEKPPLVEERAQWSEVFLVSATRVITPVHRVWAGRSLGMSNELWRNENSPSMFLEQIRSWTIEEMHRTSTDFRDL